MEASVLLLLLELALVEGELLALQDVAIRPAALPRARSDASQEAATLELLLALCSAPLSGFWARVRVFHAWQTRFSVHGRRIEVSSTRVVLVIPSSSRVSSFCLGCYLISAMAHSWLSFIGQLKSFASCFMVTHVLSETVFVRFHRVFLSSGASGLGSASLLLGQHVPGDLHLPRSWL